jgi:hypothetical protein
MLPQPPPLSSETMDTSRWLRSEERLLYCAFHISSVVQQSLEVLRVTSTTSQCSLTYEELLYQPFLLASGTWTTADDVKSTIHTYPGRPKGSKLVEVVMVVEVFGDAKV